MGSQSCFENMNLFLQLLEVGDPESSLAVRGRHSLDTQQLSLRDVSFNFTRVPAIVFTIVEMSKMHTWLPIAYHLGLNAQDFT
jgi:hypothetical protein